MEQEVNLEERQSKLESWLKARMPQAENLSIQDFVRASGGFCNDNYFFNVVWEEAGQQKSEEMVGRWEPENVLLPGNEMEPQFKVMKALENSDLPTVKAYWYEPDRGVIGTPFIIMKKINGIAPPDYAPAHHGAGFFYEEESLEKRSEWWYMAIETMARMHMLDWKKLGLTFLEGSNGGKEPVELFLAYWEKMLDWATEGVGEFPVERTALDWAKKNIPEPKYLSLHWGDARLGNLIYRNDLSGIEAMVDWDLARICPPEIDLAYFVFIDHSLAYNFQTPRLKGLPDMDETVQYYEKVSGRKLEDLYYYQVLAAFDAAVVAVMGAKVLGYMPGMEKLMAQLAQDNYGKKKLMELLKLETA